MTDFKIGDRFEVVSVDVYDDSFGIKVGDRGTVLIIDANGLVGVGMDKHNKELHSCSDLCKDGHGKWFNADQLKLVDSKEKVYVSKAELEHLYATISTATNMLHQLLERPNGK